VTGTTAAPLALALHAKPKGHISISISSLWMSLMLINTPASSAQSEF
jgi:hypothetical protein